MSYRGQLSPILRIDIVGLHGDRNISLDFTSSIKILVDENGSGKTTFLNLVVGLLQGKWKQILRYEFDHVEIQLRDTEPIVFYSRDFSEGLDALGDTLIAELATRIPEEILLELLNDAQRLPYTSLRERGPLGFVAREVGMPPRQLYESLQRLPIRKYRNLLAHQRTLFDVLSNESSALIEKFEKIEEAFPYRILYFPTYRLVEENLYNLGYDERITEPNEQLIQFGMRDVHRKWQSVTEEIRRSAVQGFSRVNGRMLDELTEGIHGDTIDYNSIQNPDALKIVLARSGDSISNASKLRIDELVRSGEIRLREYEPLAYFLSNLIEIYEQQQTIDNAIKTFVKVVNNYFDDKEVLYDETQLEIQVVSTRTGNGIQLDKLSSGEKQVLSIFSKLYLNTRETTPYAIFFDEPELSLSMEWQRNLLQDIADSELCTFLLAATHSPFIFDNSLAPFAGVLTIQFPEVTR